MKTFYPSLVCFLLSFFIIFSADAQAPDWAWSRSYGTADNETLDRIAVDSKNGVYSYGSFSGSTLQVGSTTLTNAGDKDLVLIKHDTLGAVVWAKSFGGTGLDNLGAITTDRLGNIIITGSFQNNISFDTYNFTSAGGSDVFVAKLNTNGTVLWAKQFAGTGDEFTDAVKCDWGNNIYFTGRYFTNDITIGAVTLPAALANSIFYSKLNSNGDVSWAKKNSNNTPYTLYNAEILPGNSLLLCGKASGSNTGEHINFSGLGIGMPISSTGLEFIVKCDTTGNYRQQAEVARIGSLANFTEMTLGNNGRLFASGTYLSLSSPVSGQGSITQFDTSNNISWVGSPKITGSYPSPTTVTSTVSVDIVATKDQRIFTIGWKYNGVDFRNGFISSSPDYSLFVWETDTALNTRSILTNTPTALSHPSPNAMAIDTLTNALYVAGSIKETSTIGSDVLIGQGGDDAFLTKIRIGFHTPSSNTDTLICSGNSVPMGNSAGASWGTGPYTYSWLPTTGLSDPSSPYTIATPTAASTLYVLTTTDAELHVSRDSVHISVAQTPTVPTVSASGALTFCQGGNITLTASNIPAGHIYVWSNGATTQNISVVAGGNYSVRDSVATGCVSVPSSPVTVTVNPIPAAPIITSGPLSFCEDSFTTLTANGSGTSYLWSNGATTQAIVVNSSGSYTVKETASGCNSLPSLPAVTTTAPVPSTPVISASGPLAVCNGSSITLTSSAGHNYLWSTGASTQSITVNTAGNYSLRDSVPGCASVPSAPSIVSITPVPATPTITASGSLTFCAGGNVTLTSSAGSSYLWSTGATTQAINVAASTTVHINVSAAGCTSLPSANATVIVNPLPAIPVITQSGNILTSSAASGNQWYYNGNSISGATGNQYNYTLPGDYSVTVTDANGCNASSEDHNAGFANGTITTLRNGEPFLHFVSPNPAQANSYINFNLRSASNMSIAIIGENGFKVAELVNGQNMAAGDHRIALGNNFYKLKSGLYIITYIINGEKVTDKIVAVK